MNIEGQKIRYINNTMNSIYDLCGGLYEALIDNDSTDIDSISSELCSILKEVNQTFKNEF